MTSFNVPEDTSASQNASSSTSSSQYTPSLGSPQYNGASCNLTLVSPPYKRASETQKTSSTAPKKRKLSGATKEQEQDLLHMEMLYTLKLMDKQPEKGDAENSNILFLKSLFPILDKLPRKKNGRARMKMQEILFDLEDSDG